MSNPDRHQKWLSTPEGVADSIEYHGEDPAMTAHIVATILRLPPKVARFVFDRCCFVSLGQGILGLTLPGRIGTDDGGSDENRWVIVLSDDLASHETESTVAHEIAHAWLKHDRLDDMPEDCESQAAALAKEWGFSGRGADPELQAALEAMDPAKRPRSHP